MRDLDRSLQELPSQRQGIVFLFEPFTSCAHIRWGGSGMGCQTADGWNPLEPDHRGYFRKGGGESWIHLKLSLGKLFFRQPQLNHHPLLAFVIDQEMAMEENPAVFFKVRSRDGLAPGTVGIEGRGPQDDVLAVERAVALANRHRRLARVVPHGGEAIRFVIEAGDSGAGALRSVSTNEDEIGL